MDGPGTSNRPTRTARAASEARTGAVAGSNGGVQPGSCCKGLGGDTFSCLVKCRSSKLASPRVVFIEMPHRVPLELKAHQRSQSAAEYVPQIMDRLFEEATQRRSKLAPAQFLTFRVLTVLRGPEGYLRPC